MGGDRQSTWEHMAPTNNKPCAQHTETSGGQPGHTSRTVTSLCTGYLFLFRISYTILLLTYKALNDLAPAYLTNILSRYNPTRSLRSQNSGILVVPRIAKSSKEGRAFSYLAPKFWNSLPDNVHGSDTLYLFKFRLKTHLFSQAFI